MRFLILLCLSCAMLPVFAQEKREAEDIMVLFATLTGEWQGELILEEYGKEPHVLNYGMEVTTGAGGDVLLIRHRFHFPNGLAESVEISSYDQTAKTLRLATIAARERIIEDIQIKEVDASKTPGNWRILGERDGDSDGNKVRIRYLYQMQKGKFSKFRWTGTAKDGFALSYSVTLERVEAAGDQNPR